MIALPTAPAARGAREEKLWRPRIEAPERPGKLGTRMLSGQFDIAGEHRWGVILSGGDGMRLRSLTRLLTGDDRPKQFCRIVGAETLLAQTRQRVARIVRPERTLFVVTKSHEPFYA